MDLLSPRKKRRTLESADDTDTFTTPKKLRADLLSSHSKPNPTNPKSPLKHAPASTSLPAHLSRLLNIQTSLQHALSVALATSAVSPCTDTGRVPNVLTHLSLTSSMGFRVSCSVDDIKRLCWLWEWDGITVDADNDASENKTQTQRGHQVQPRVQPADEDEDNPFLDDSPSFETDDSNNNNSADWIRGAMGFIITSTTHFVKTEGRRVPAYGIGIEVEIDMLAEGMGGGMSSVAKWTGDGEGRKKELERKLKAWVEMQKEKTTKNENEEPNIPHIPLASLPPLPTNSSPTKLSSLTALLKSKSKPPTPLSTPQKPLTRTPSSTRKTVPKFILPTPPSKNSLPFPSTPRTPIESPTKSLNSPSIDTPSAITPRNQLRSGPGPGSRSSSPTKSAGLSLLSRSLTTNSSIPGKTASSSIENVQEPEEEKKLSSIPFPPQTPSTANRTGIYLETPQSRSRSSVSSLILGTPSSSIVTASTPRRAALLERIRLKSFSSDDSPSKSKEEGGECNGSMTREQLRLLGQEEMRRRVLLGRLDEVAATVWAAFSSPSQTSSTPLSVARKRRTMRFDEIVRAVVSSARVPISSADAQDSVSLLMNLCPFFLRPLIIEGEEWVEMPASNPNNPTTPPSPRRKNVSEEEVRNRSPKSVRMEAKGGLRDVRERIRREIEECSI